MGSGSRRVAMVLVGVIGVGCVAMACESLGGLSGSDAADGGGSDGGSTADAASDATTDAAPGEGDSGSDASGVSLRCGTTRCSTGQVCCADRDAGTFACVAPQDCFAVTFRCDDTADCIAQGFPPSTQCCGLWGGSACGMTKSSCGTCPETNGMMCDPDLPFACGDSGASCVPLQCWPNTYSICQ